MTKLWYLARIATNGFNKMNHEKSVCKYGNYKWRPNSICYGQAFGVCCLRAELANSESLHFGHPQKFQSQVLLVKRRCCGSKNYISSLFEPCSCDQELIFRYLGSLNFSGRSLNEDWIRGRVKRFLVVSIRYLKVVSLQGDTKTNQNKDR